MIRKISQLSVRPQQIIKNQFGSHGPIPQRLPKVNEKAIRLNVKNSTGKWQQVLGFPGQSFLNVLQRMKVKGVQQDICDGFDFTYRPHQRPHDPFTDGPQCGKCRIFLRGNWFDRVHEQTDGYVDNEQHTLLGQHQHRQNLRLACCIPVQAWMDGIQLEVIPPLQIGGLGELN